MITFPTSDRRTFASKARELGKPVEMTRTKTTILRREGQYYQELPAVRIDYRFSFDYEGRQVAWIYSEVRPVLPDGTIDTEDSLMNDLEQSEVAMEVSHLRSGSL